MLSLGIDLGSSAVKVSVYDHDQGRPLASKQYPEQEMEIMAVQPAWAEQEPDWWWEAFLRAYRELVANQSVNTAAIKCIGIAYQMHGLVCLDRFGQPLRPSIIWCDSRAVSYGEAARLALGEDYVFGHLLNSPGNFTAAKLAWVKAQESDLYARIDKICLPGDYLSYRLTGELTTTISGLSEGVFYDFVTQAPSQPLLAHFGFSPSLLPTVRSSFADHGQLRPEVAQQLGLSPTTRVTYKAGDQPNNALSLNVLQAGEVAATAGTSGVVYGISDQLFVDTSQRVNSFAHVNYTPVEPRIGVLLCINGTGIANAWAKRWTGAASYASMNELAATVVPGSEGLQFFPFGNGSERMLANTNLGSQLRGLQFTRHQPAHLYRAVQEGIAYAFRYGLEAFAAKQIEPRVIRAGHANLLLSPLFAQLLATLAGVSIELYDTDGALGAARGALIGADYLSVEEAFYKLRMLQRYEPVPADQAEYQALYEDWKAKLHQSLQ